MNRFGDGNATEWWLPNHRWTRRPPSKIRSAYAYFVQGNYHRIGRILGSRAPQEILRGLSQAWRNMSEEEKRVYRQRNLDDRGRFRTTKDKWAKTFKGRMPRMRRKPKPVDAPKRSRTPYIFFLLDNWRKVQAEFPEWPQEEIVMEVARRWRLLSETEKDPYKKRSQADKDRYASEMREYRERNRIGNREIRLSCIRQRYHVRQCRQVALDRVRHLEIRLSRIRQQNRIEREQREADAAVRPPAPPIPAGDP